MKPHKPPVKMKPERIQDKIPRQASSLKSVVLKWIRIVAQRLRKALGLNGNDQQS